MNEQHKQFNSLSELLVRLQRAVMANRTRGGDEEVKKGGGSALHAPVHAQFMVLGVQTLAWFMVLQATALAVKAISLTVGCRLKSERLSYSALLHIPGVPAIMVRPRQRLLSRRGSARGGSSRPPVEESQSHCCRCHCHRIAEANPLQTSQFMDSSSPNSEPAPMPAFGSAIFNFSSSLNRPRISAHVSVLFLEDSPDGGDSQDNRGKHPVGGSKNVMEKPADVPENVSNRPLAQEMTTRKGDNVNMDSFPTAEEMEKYGWCRVVEEEPDK